MELYFCSNTRRLHFPSSSLLSSSDSRLLILFSKKFMAGPLLLSGAGSAPVRNVHQRISIYNNIITTEQSATLPVRPVTYYRLSLLYDLEWPLCDLDVDWPGALLAAHISTGRELGCLFRTTFSISFTCRSRSWIFLASTDRSFVLALASASFLPVYRSEEKNMDVLL